MVDLVVLGQPAEPDVDVAVEGDVLVEVGRVPDPAWVDVAVEHHAPHPRREQGRVDLAQVGAVGEAVVVDLLRAEGRADAVHVLGRVGGLHVGQQRPAVGPAGLGVGVRAGEPGPLELLGLGDVVGTVVAEVVGQAAQGGLARADAARVEADPVVRVPRVVGHELAEHRQPQAGAAWPAGVDQHDALVVRRRRGVHDARDRERDLLAVRLVVVERHLQVAALGVRLVQVGVRARPPLDAAGGRDRLGGGRRGRTGGGERRAGERHTVLRLAARARTRSPFIDTYFFLPSGSRASDEGRSLRPEAGMGQTRIITT